MVGESKQNCSPLVGLNQLKRPKRNLGWIKHKGGKICYQKLGEKEMEDIPILKLRIETEEYIYEEYVEA